MSASNSYAPEVRLRLDASAAYHRGDLKTWAELHAAADAILQQHSDAAIAVRGREIERERDRER